MWRTQRHLAAKVFRVAASWPGKLGILPRPRGRDWLGDEARAWREAGIDIVVSLLEPEEQAQFFLEREGASAAAAGVEFSPFPVPDRGSPLRVNLTTSTWMSGSAPAS